jgi:hypothetical protein
MPTAIQTQFNAGMQGDKRTRRSAGVTVSEGFDIYSSPGELRPQVDFIDDNNGTGTGITNFLYANDLLYGLGQISDVNTRVKIYTKDVNAGITSNWSTPSNAEQTALGNPDKKVFVHYNDSTDGEYIYGLKGGTHVWRWGPITGGATFDDEYEALTYTTAAQGLVHPLDNTLYIPYDNKIASHKDGAFTANTYEVPSGYIIRSIAVYGRYLAVGCENEQLGGNSRVFLWNRVDTKADDDIDFGTGRLKVLANLENNLVGISLAQGTSPSTGKLVARLYQGAGNSRVFKTLNLNETSGQLFTHKFEDETKIFFAGTYQKDTGASQTVIFGLGRENANQEIAWTVDQVAPEMNGEGDIYKINNVWFYGNSDAAADVKRTDDGSVTYQSAIAETLVNPGMDTGDVHMYKKFNTFWVNTAPFSSDTVTVKYRKDAETSWTTFLTASEDGQLRFEADPSINFFNEVQFRFETISEATITGFGYTYDVVDRT